MVQLDERYWSNRYEQRQAGWDIGEASAPLVQFTDWYPDKSASVFIPGCGNAYEAGQLLLQGFQNITLLDLSATLVAGLQEQFRDTSVQVLAGNFFEHAGQYDLILEQTFFCAIDPRLRDPYVDQMYELLKPGGMVAGVLFNRSFEGGPPFGGSKEEYEQRFRRKFNIKKMELCINSISARKGTELFFVLEKSGSSHFL